MATIGQVRDQREAVRGHKDHMAAKAEREGGRIGSGQGNKQKKNAKIVLNVCYCPQTTLSDLTAQLAILKRPTPGDSSEIKALMIRANNAERRLANAQNQLAAAEEKMAAMNQKTTAADSKWEARVKEYEARLRAAEEKVKRERQGYKERMVELENQIKCVVRRRCFPLALREYKNASNAASLIFWSLSFSV